MRVQHVKHAPNPEKCFIFTDFVPCSYFELQQGDGVTAMKNYDLFTFLCSKQICKSGLRSIYDFFCHLPKCRKLS